MKMMKFGIALLLSLILLGSDVGRQGDRLDTELVSHRGIYYRDNSIAAFKQALHLGFDSLEADLHLHHGVVVLSHDRPAEGQHYDSLEDLLTFSTSNDVKLWLETKSGEVVLPALELIRQFEVANIVIISFTEAHLQQVRQLLPDIATGIIHSSPDYSKDIPYEWVVLSKDLVRQDYRALAHVKIAAWTIKSQQDYRMVASFVDAVISDVQLAKRK